MTKMLENELAWIKETFKKTGQKIAVIGISGGKDSSVVAALCAAALGKENVFGVLMPCGEQKDISDSLQLVNHLGIKYTTVNIGDTFNTLCNAINLGAELTYDTKTNLPARLRMSTLYAVAQTIGGFVANTCNLSEDIVGYATLYGDNAGSFAPLSRLTTEEIVALGDELGLPYNLTHKIPVDGLQPKTDEDKLGFTYHEVNELVRKGVRGPNYEKIMKMYRANKFKTEIVRIPYFDPHLPNVIDTI